MPRAGFSLPSNLKLLKARLTVTDSKWDKNAHTWTVTLIFDLSYLDEPAPDAPIIFFKDGKQLEEDIGKDPILTDNQGRATRDFEGLIPGKYRFEGFIKDTTIGDSGTKEIKGPQIELSLGEQEADGGKYKLAATAIAKTPTGDPVPEVLVQFYKNEREDGPPIPTDDQGRAQKEFLDLTKGHYSFKAMIIGTAVSSRQSKEIKEDKPKKPSVVEVSRRKRPDGNYDVTVQVFDEDGSSVKGEPVFVEDAESDVPKKRVGATDQDGMVTFALTLTGARKEITISVRDKRKLQLFYK